jgi:TolB-like protein
MLDRGSHSTAPLRALAGACALAISLAACASGGAGSLYVHPNVDWTNYSRIAVLPLENMTSEGFAAERVREMLQVEINAQGLLEAVDSGEVNRALRSSGVVNLSEMGPAEVAALGGELKVQALLAGSVMEFEERRTGSISVPEVALSLRLIDVETGLVIWAVTDARAGAKLSTRLFGVGEESQTDATLKLIRDVLRTLE